MDVVNTCCDRHGNPRDADRSRAASPAMMAPYFRRTEEPGMKSELFSLGI